MRTNRLALRNRFAYAAMLPLFIAFLTQAWPTVQHIAMGVAAALTLITLYIALGPQSVRRG